MQFAQDFIFLLVCLYNCKLITVLFLCFFLIFFLTDSVEGDGDVLSDSGARKAGHTEGALLQVAL